jgi:hypothetical protein
MKVLGVRLKLERNGSKGGLLLLILSGKERY